MKKEKETKLSSEDQQYILENKNLVYKVLQDNNLYTQSEELFSVGVIAMIEAYNNFKRNARGEAKLSTYLYVAIKRAIFYYLKTKRKDPLEDAILFSRLTPFEDNEEIIFDPPSSYSLENEFESKSTIEEISFTLSQVATPRSAEIFCRFYGLNCLQEYAEDLAEDYNCTIQNIHNIVKSTKKRILAKLNQDKSVEPENKILKKETQKPIHESIVQLDLFSYLNGLEETTDEEYIILKK